MKKQPKGIGGWLLFYILAVTVFDPLAYLYYTSVSVDAAYYLGYHALDILNLLFGIWAAILMWREDPTGLRLTKRFLWIALILAGLKLISPHPPSLSSAGLTYPIIWLIYLKESKRVQNTFGIAQPIEFYGTKSCN
jgi:hypothetical protein